MVYRWRCNNRRFVTAEVPSSEVVCVLFCRCWVFFGVFFSAASTLVQKPQLSSDTLRDQLTVLSVSLQPRC